MAVVSVEEVRRVALLARLALSEQELQRLAPQLDEILEYVRQLQSVSTTDVEPTSHVLPLADITRPDQSSPCLPSEEALRLAPARHGHLVKVPRVIE